MQLAQNELRDDDEAVEESGFGDVGDAAVDNDAGIEDLVAFLARSFAAKDSAEGGEIEKVAFISAHGQSHVGHDQHDHDLQETSGGAGLDAAADDEGEKISAKNAQHAADGGSDEALQAHGAQTPLEHYDGDAEQQADDGGIGLRQVKGAKEKADDTDDEDKQKAYK